MKLSRKARLYTAAGLWVAVSIMLIWRGTVPYLASIDSDTGRVAALCGALVLGGLKGWFVLAKSARRTARFIERRPEKDWLWFSVHPLLYLLIPLMIAAGLFLRAQWGEAHPWVVVVVYVGVAAAMLTGIRGFFAEARELDAAPQGS